MEAGIKYLPKILVGAKDHYTGNQETTDSWIQEAFNCLNTLKFENRLVIAYRTKITPCVTHVTINGIFVKQPKSGIEQAGREEKRRDVKGSQNKTCLGPRSRGVITHIQDSGNACQFSMVTLLTLGFDFLGCPLKLLFSNFLISSDPFVK